jgi:hypothetical protein
VTGDRTLATRTVTGVVAGMVLVTAAATAVGFWLSYSGLHDFALRAGLRGPEAWAWPSSVDLFIAAGEAGVTISALRKESDWPAWCYLGLGLAMSVTGNVMHVYVRHLPWPPYVVAAVPPVAAMLALGALLRQVYRLASERPEITRGGAASDLAGVSNETPGTVSSDAIEAAKARLRLARTHDFKVSDNDLRAQFRLTRSEATKLRTEVLAEANGSAMADGDADGAE